MALEPCRECGQSISTEATKCPHCGAMNPTPAKQKANKKALLVGCGLPMLLLLGFCAYVASDISDGGESASPSASHQSSEVQRANSGSEEQRLAVAADIRRYLREQDIPAYVVASGTRLSISYRAALIDYVPETFFQQQGQEGIRRLASAGFETLVIEANDANGRTQKRGFPIASLVAQEVTDSVSRARTRAEISGVRLIPWTLPTNGREAQMVLTDWRNTGERPIRVVHADIIAYDDRGTEIDSSARDYTIYVVCNSAPGIAPGEEYQEPVGEGFVLIPIPTLVPRADSVAVRITDLAENASC